MFAALSCQVRDNRILIQAPLALKEATPHIDNHMSQVGFFIHSL